MFDYLISFLLGALSSVLLFGGLLLHRLGSILKEESKSSDQEPLEDSV